MPICNSCRWCTDKIVDNKAGVPKSLAPICWSGERVRYFELSIWPADAPVNFNDLPKNQCTFWQEKEVVS